MNRLNFLPPELLNQITTYVLSYDLANLWFCGDKLLNRRLLDRGVTVFRHEYNQVSLKFLWPSFFGIFIHLEELYISDMIEDRNTSFDKVDFSLLPSSLKILHLNFLDSYSDFSNFINSSSSKDLCPLPRLRHLTAIPRGQRTNQCIPVFPSLESLDICTSYGGFTVELSTQELPDGLKSLSVHGLAFSPLQCLGSANSSGVNESSLRSSSSSSSSSSSYLPVSSLAIAPYALLYIPSALTSLSIHSIGEYFNSPNHIIGCLPSNLKHLEIRSTISLFSSSLLPRQMRSVMVKLESSELPDDFMESLPTGLKKLSLGYKVTLSSHQLAKLPRSLTTLIDLLPSDMTAGDCQQLPKSLTKVNLTVDLPIRGLRHLPLLRDIILYDTSNESPEEVAEAVASLKYLTNLEIDQYPEAMNGKLPESLTSLRLSSGDISTQGLKSLPRSLKSFVTLRTQPAYDSSDLESLPPGLTELHILSAFYKDDHHPVISLDHSNSLLLPRTLTLLSLGPIRGITADWLAGLPPTLNSLGLVANHFPLEGLKLLPYKHLHTLHLTLQSVLSRREILGILRVLPRCLLQLSITSDSLDGSQPPDNVLFDEDVVLIPRAVEDLRLPKCPMLTSKCYPDLPPSLHHLQLKYECPDWFTGPYSKVY